MAYSAYPRRVTRAHRKAMIDLVGEDSIVHGREVGLFELMTALETPDVQKEIVRGHVNDKTIKQVHPELIPLRRIRRRMQKLQQEQEKRDKEWTKLNELRNVLREGQERLDLHDFGGTLDDTYERIKTEPIEDWQIHHTPEPSTPPPQWAIEDAVPTPCNCGPCLRSYNQYGFRTLS